MHFAAKSVATPPGQDCRPPSRDPFLPPSERAGIFYSAHMRAALITTQICGVVSETHERLRKNYRQPIYVTPRPCAPQGQMTTFLQPDEATNVDFAEPRQKRDRDRVACFLHLRDLVYLHPKAASADAIAFVQKLEAAVIAEKAAREKRH